MDGPREEAFRIACSFNTILNPLLWIGGGHEATVEGMGNIVTGDGLLGGHKTVGDSRSAVDSISAHKAPQLLSVGEGVLRTKFSILFRE